MTEVTLTIYSAGGRRVLTMEGDRLVIGRSDGAARHARTALLVEDDGLDPRHASINREGMRVWVLDEDSPGGTFVNGRRVPRQGSPLADGDEISVGEHTSIVVHLRALSGSHEPPPDESDDARGGNTPRRPPSPFAVVAPIFCLVLLAVVAVALVGGRGADKRRERTTLGTGPGSAPPVESRPSPEPREEAGSNAAVAPLPPLHDGGDQHPGDSTAGDETAVADAGRASSGAKRYLQMSNEEQMRFLEERARHVSTMMGNRPYVFNDEVLLYIKQYVDVYARRVGNNSHRMWGEDLRFVFARARTSYAPPIIRAFNARGVPPVVGLYLVCIETEFRNIESDNAAGAAGLFQFIGPTARLYGVEPSERTNVEKMAPAAAHYMSDRIAEFGPDSMSVALAIAGYNRSPDSVRRDLRDVLDSNNKERSFWTLVANSGQLDHWFQNENVKYVPKFFAAAIVGENPEAFGLDMRKLSTYTTPEDTSR